MEIVNHNMARAICTVSIGRGHDPRQFVLVACGGAGPLHVCRLAELLDIPVIVIPPRPGVLSTYGLLCTDLKNDYVQTCYQEGPPYEISRIEAVYTDLEGQADGAVRPPNRDQTCILRADGRLCGDASLRPRRVRGRDDARRTGDHRSG